MRSPSLLLLPLLFAPACAASVASGPSRTAVDLETTVVLPVVLASVDGAVPQPFILDTGAAVSVVAAAEALPPGPVRLGGVAVGGMVFRDVPAQRAVLPEDLKVAGILSPQDAFRGALVELDGRALVLRLYRDLDEAGWRALVGEPVHSAALSWEEGLAKVEARVGGATLALRLDSGAGACTLPAAELARLGHPGAGEAVLPVSVGDSTPGREQVFAMDGPGSVGFPWFVGRRAALTPDRRTLLFTDR